MCMSAMGMGELLSTLKDHYEEERKPFWSAFVGNLLGVIDIGGG